MEALEVPRTPKPRNLESLVTLGAKLGAGTFQKQISSATSNPLVLARWINRSRCLTESHEIQVSVGYDTGGFPALEQRGKFISLMLFIASTDLDEFRALAHCPQRDFGAAYGLLIRGQVVEAKYPGQKVGKRLDYIFHLSPLMTEKSMAVLLKQIQTLNLGLLLATAEDWYCMFFPGRRPPWMDRRMSLVALAYREFERDFVRLLREYDEFRDADEIFPLDADDHRERREAVRQYTLEECLFPQYGWVVPLFGEDRKWESLVGVLRAVEAVILHQGRVPDSDLTRGHHFIRDVRTLGYSAMERIEEILRDPAPEDAPLTRVDPFIDHEHEWATRYYLSRAANAMTQGEMTIHHLPDLATFLKASEYYEVSLEEALPHRKQLLS